MTSAVEIISGRRGGDTGLGQQLSLLSRVAPAHLLSVEVAALPSPKHRRREAPGRRAHPEHTRDAHGGRCSARPRPAHHASGASGPGPREATSRPGGTRLAPVGPAGVTYRREWSTAAARPARTPGPLSPRGAPPAGSSSRWRPAAESQPGVSAAGRPTPRQGPRGAAPRHPAAGPTQRSTNVAVTKEGCGRRARRSLFYFRGTRASHRKRKRQGCAGQSMTPLPSSPLRRGLILS